LSGLILDNDNNIVARPFEKFFNFGEVEEHKNLLEKTPKYILEKLDGSLGILFYYNNEWLITTRGSFDSEQAIEAKKMLSQYKLKYLNIEYTYLVEIVYKANRIVIEYTDEQCGLYILGACLTNYENNIEKMMDLNTLFEQAKLVGFKLPKVYKFDSVKQLMKWMKDNPTDNAEGYVVTYDDGYKVKVKYEQYCILHKIITGLTEHKIWEALSNNCENELLNIIPDEFYKFVDDIIIKLNNKFKIVENIVNLDWNNILKMQFTSRKEFALEVLSNKYKYPKLLFMKLDNKPIVEFIWKTIEP